MPLNPVSKASFDKLVRKCTRWPYGVFFTYVDVAVIVVMLTNSTSHYVFKKKLAYELLLLLVKARAQKLTNIPVALQ